MNLPRAGLLLLAALAPLRCATLQQLSLDDMIARSTAVVRGRVQPTGSAIRGNILYSHFRVQVSEQWKGNSGSSLDIVVPGGRLGNLVQTFAGAPALSSSVDYVLFLWTSRSGLTQVIGLSQGLFTIVQSASGQQIASRNAITEPALDASGQPVAVDGLRLPLSDLRYRVLQATGRQQ